MVLHCIIENILKISKNKEKIGIKEVVTEEKLFVIYICWLCMFFCNASSMYLQTRMNHQRKEFINEIFTSNE